MSKDLSTNWDYEDIQLSDDNDDSNGIIKFDKYIFFISPICYGEGGLKGSFRYGYERKKGWFNGDYSTILDYLTGEEISVKVINGIDNRLYFIPIDSNIYENPGINDDSGIYDD